MVTEQLPAPFGKYILLNKIAMGGMAEIFRAKTIGAEGFEKEIVIKRILPHYTEDDAFVTMFIDEAKVSSGLNHPNIVQVYDFDKIGESYYIAMEYVEGKDLKRIMDDCVSDGEPLSVPQVVHIITEVCKGLHYAHVKSNKGQPLNIVHRDVSPHNVMLSYDGEVKVMDFGIAKAAARSTKTRAGTVKGKCAYMSTEQARGKNLDGRSDMFAVGVIMWEMLTNRRLFAGESDFETLSNVLKMDVPKPSTINDEVPEAIDEIVLKILSKDRDDRFTDCRELMRELEHWFYENVLDHESGDMGEYLRMKFAEDLAALEELQSHDAETNFLEVQELVRAQREISGSNPQAVPGTGSNIAVTPPSTNTNATVALDSKDLPNLQQTGQQPAQSNSLYIVLSIILLIFGIGGYAMFLYGDSGGAQPQVVRPPPPPAPVQPKPAAAQAPKVLKAQEVTVKFTVVPSEATIQVPPDHKGKGELVIKATVGSTLSAVFEHNGYQRLVKRDIQVKQDGQTIAEVLEKKPEPVAKAPVIEKSVFAVTVAPKTARLSVNGQPQTAASPGQYLVSGYNVGDKVSVVVANSGFLTQKTTVTLSQAAFSATYTLKKRPEAPKGPGKAVFNAKPWAKVSVKGKRCTTPCSMTLMSGRYSATFKQGGTTKRKGFKVRPGKTTRVMVNMK